MSNYKLWNTLVVKKPSGQVLNCIPAHDGDFFPETVADYIKGLKQRQKFIDAGIHKYVAPIRVDIDITQDCNSNCMFCFSRRYQIPGYRNEMAKLPEISRLLNELAQLGTRTVRFCGGGDCLVHPRIKDILPLPHKHGLQFCIITNGDLLTHELCEHILEYVDHFRWSVNASSDQTRIKIHRPQSGGNRLSETLELIRYITNQRQRSLVKKKSPLIWTTFLILPDNMHEILPACSILKDIGVDSVSFRPVYHGLGGKWTNSNLKQLPLILADAKKLSEPPNFLVFVPNRNITESPKLIPTQHFEYCLSREFRTVLESTSKGLALQSCGIYRGKGSTRGLVFTEESNFSDLWQNANENFFPAHSPSDCPHCIDISINKTLNLILDVLKIEPTAIFSQEFVL